MIPASGLVERSGEAEPLPRWRCGDGRLLLRSALLTVRPTRAIGFGAQHNQSYLDSSVN